MYISYYGLDPFNNPQRAFKEVGILASIGYDSVMNSAALSILNESTYMYIPMSEQSYNELYDDVMAGLESDTKVLRLGLVLTIDPRNVEDIEDTDLLYRNLKEVYEQHMEAFK